MTFEEACAAINAIAAAERSDDKLDPLGRSRLLSHGNRTRGAIVFFHGFTNCPQQFVDLGTRFFESGYNVYIPRMPGHGMLDKMTTALEDVSLDDLANAALNAARFAAGLGDRVHVAGISMGGLLAAYLGEQVPLAGATAIAPFLAIDGMPMWVDTILASALNALPNFFLWWDPRTGPRNPMVPPYAYARYPSRAIGQQLRLSGKVQSRAKDCQPQARVSSLFINAHDPAVNNTVAQRLYDRWANCGAKVLTEKLDLGPLPHDIVDNFAHKLPVEKIYPRIADLIERTDSLAQTTSR